MPKLSVIVPVFKAERYVKKCADSLFEQSLDDIEFIFVDDCSPDRSIDIIKASVSIHPSIENYVIFVRMNSNSGSVAARLEGLKKATGEYVIFCDSDDWVEKDTYRLMYEKAVKDNLDIVIGSICEHKGEKQIYKKRWFSESEDLISSLLSYRLSPSICIKMTKRELWNKMFVVPSASMGEDSVFSLQLLLVAQRVGFEPEALYNYYVNPSGMCQSLEKERVIKRFNEAKANTDQIVKILEKVGLLNNYHRELFVLKARHRDYLLPITGERQYYEMWHSTYPEINFKLLFNKTVPISLKIRYLTAITKIYPLLKWIKESKYTRGHSI